MINTVIWPADSRKGGHELSECVRDKTACCQGMSLLYIVLGRAIGLDVAGLEVELMADAPSPDGIGHVACLVKLSDGLTIMADATKQVGRDEFVSKAFRFDELFCPLGTYWQLKDKSNPLGLHQIVHREDASGMISMLEVVRAIKLIDTSKCGGLSLL